VRIRVTISTVLPGRTRLGANAAERLGAAAPAVPAPSDPGETGDARYGDPGASA